MSLEDRSKYLLEVFEKHQIPKDASILEIGAGDWRNIDALRRAGYKNAIGIDKEPQAEVIPPMAIEDMPSREFDVIFTMSCLFLIPEPPYEKIAQMAKKYLITIEGETTKGNGVIGRDYGEIFTKLGFEQIEHQEEVFNKFGVMRVFKK